MVVFLLRILVLCFGLLYPTLFADARKESKNGQRGPLLRKMLAEGGERMLLYKMDF
jgi:hypothetical protein